MQVRIAVFALGIIAAGFLPVLPDRFQIALALGILLVLWPLRRLQILVLFCFGALWLCNSAVQQIQRRLPEPLEQIDLWVTGQVHGLPQQQHANTRFHFIPDNLCPTKKLTSCAPWTGQHFLLTDYTGEWYQPGEKRTLQVRLKRPYGFANPGGYDFERWLFQQGITATGYVRDVVSDDTGDNAANASLLSRVDSLRLRFRTHLDQLSLRAPGLVKALTIGERQSITDEQSLAMSVTGTNHLLVISGLHIGLVTWSAFVLCQRLFRFFPTLCLHITAGRLAVLPAMLAAMSHALFAGLTLPVQRALVMVLVVLLGRVLRRQSKPVNTLCLALLVILLVDPMAPQSGGFWLSFVAVGCLLLAVGRRSVKQGTIQSLPGLQLYSQGYLFLMMAPLMLVLFNQLSLLAPLVNLVAIPFIGMLVVPVCLLGAAGILLWPETGQPLILIADRLLDFFMGVLTYIANEGGDLLLAFPAIPPLFLILLSGISFWQCYSPAYWRLILLAGMLLLGYRYEAPDRITQGAVQIDILDVGQGLSVLLSTRHHHLLYDAGPWYSQGFNAGTGIIQPFLKASNMPFPDLVIISHGDMDHAGGLAPLAALHPDTPIMSGEPLRGIPSSACHTGQHWTWDGVRFDILSPSSVTEGNNASCVLMVSAGSYKLLLPGDIEGGVELELVRKYGNLLDADILLAPHHGSISSSLTPFIRHINPSLVIFTTGHLNRFGHPHERVIKRYKSTGASVMNSALTGHIRMSMSETEGISTPRIYRQENRHFWSQPYRKVGEL
jgi:competence protein ComEC